MIPLYDGLQLMQQLNDLEIHYVINAWYDQKYLGIPWPLLQYYWGLVPCPPPVFLRLCNRILGQYQAYLGLSLPAPYGNSFPFARRFTLYLSHIWHTVHWACVANIVSETFSYTLEVRSNWLQFNSLEVCSLIDTVTNESKLLMTNTWWRSTVEITWCQVRIVRVASLVREKSQLYLS